MAEKSKPLLMNELTLGEKAALGQVTMMPGFQVIVKLIEAGCNRATADTINVDPEDPNYNQILTAKHHYSHDVNVFTRLVRQSIEYHVQYGIVEEAQREAEAKSAVEKATSN